MPTRQNALKYTLMTAAVGLIIACWLALVGACGPSAPPEQRAATTSADKMLNTPTPTMPATVALPANVVLLPGNADVDGDGVWDYEAVDVDTGNVLRFDIYPTALTVHGSYPEGDKRLDLGGTFPDRDFAMDTSNGTALCSC